MEKNENTKYSKILKTRNKTLQINILGWLYKHILIPYKTLFKLIF